MQQEINRQNFLRSKYFSSRYKDSSYDFYNKVIKVTPDFFADDAEFEFIGCRIPFNFVMIYDKGHGSIETYDHPDNNPM
jgi:hypothetical protein|uniref:Uncharacterized protein n=1 Tax=viral metagenome TaxID=1070528 RepID=A0A6C0IUZ3_9ZZZZ